MDALQVQAGPEQTSGPESAELASAADTVVLLWMSFHAADYAAYQADELQQDGPGITGLIARAECYEAMEKRAVKALFARYDEPAGRAAIIAAVNRLLSKSGK